MPSKLKQLEAEAAAAQAAAGQARDRLAAARERFVLTARAGAEACEEWIRRDDRAGLDLDRALADLQQAKADLDAIEADLLSESAPAG